MGNSDWDYRLGSEATSSVTSDEVSTDNQTGDECSSGEKPDGEEWLHQQPTLGIGNLQSSYAKGKI